MIHSRFVFFALITLSILLADAEATKVVSDGAIWSPNKSVSFCCSDHPEMGVCDEISCNEWCIHNGCVSERERGGYCKNKICHCACP
ncbi:hypothetical protein Bca4012_009488 [Brassica carinata]